MTHGLFRNEPTYRSELAAIKAFIPKKGRGLEIGVGTWRFAEPLGIKEGVEPAKAMAAIARERGIKSIRLMLKNFLLRMNPSILS
jgi:hypothetical protein